jgi:DNA gyrase subunit A
MPGIEQVALHEATRRRYLNYALSVITARALPDVRDGLKPVQRRILYGMFNNLRLMPDGRYRKSAAVVGEVMAKYHPHGDLALYEAMVRMAQPFALLHPLVDGQGNFGSPDGDSAAAMRYTECRLTATALELLREVPQRTVGFRPTYDGQNSEPVVLPARFPQLLVNGSEGIAVGMATRIPPHNLREVVDAAVLLLDKPETSCDALSLRLQGPDFPTGGVILNNRAELCEIYATGTGPVRLRGEWNIEKVARKAYIIVTSIPYALNRASLVEKIGELILARKIPQLLDVRDESTEQTRIVLELRAESDAEAAMAFLFRHTPLQSSFHVNLTALVPTRNPEVCAPARLDLKTLLRHWLDFRLETVRRRFEYDLQKLKERIHILEGFEAIFVDLDEAIRLIRASEGRRDAAERLMDRFRLDDIQADAILELKLYRLARMEILEIQVELADKRTEAARIEAILSAESELWKVVRSELLEVRKVYGRARRTRVATEEEGEPSYREDAYIVQEDTYLVVTRDGWMKRQNSFSGVERLRMREGDGVGWLFRSDTRSSLAVFTDRGSVYTLRASDVTVTTGYGEPVQRHFQFADGERIVGVLSFDPRCLPETRGGVPESAPSSEEEEDDASEIPPPPYGIAATRRGRILRFSLLAFEEISSRGGRRYAKLQDEHDAVLAVWPTSGDEHACLATESAHALTFPVAEVNVVRGAGKGVTGIKIGEHDRLVAFDVVGNPDEGAHIRTRIGKDILVCPDRYAGRRGGKGSVVYKRDLFTTWELRPTICLGPPESGPGMPLFEIPSPAGEE